MNFFQAIPRYGSCGMLVKWPEITSKIQLLMYIDLLVAEDFPDR